MDDNANDLHDRHMTRMSWFSKTIIFKIFISIYDTALFTGNCMKNN